MKGSAPTGTSLLHTLPSPWTTESNDTDMWGSSPRDGQDEPSAPGGEKTSHRSIQNRHGLLGPCLPFGVSFSGLSLSTSWQFPFQSLLLLWACFAGVARLFYDSNSFTIKRIRFNDWATDFRHSPYPKDGVQNTECAQTCSLHCYLRIWKEPRHSTTQEWLNGASLGQRVNTQMSQPLSICHNCPTLPLHQNQPETIYEWTGMAVFQ